VFERARDVTGQLGPLHDLMEIAELHRLDPPDNNPDPLWHIEGQNFEFRLRAPATSSICGSHRNTCTGRSSLRPSAQGSASPSTPSPDGGIRFCPPSAFRVE
jgi:hypothetical protein